MNTNTNTPAEIAFHRACDSYWFHVEYDRPRAYVAALEAATAAAELAKTSPDFVRWYSNARAYADRAIVLATSIPERAKASAILIGLE